jgi:serpin B
VLTERASRYTRSIESINGFAVDLSRRATRDRGNLLLAPLSIHAALGLAFAGAAGQTAAELARVLRWPGDLGTPPSAVAVEEIFDPGTPDQLLLASALWLQAGLLVPPRIAPALGACLHRVDFASDPRQACQTINTWFTTQTSGMIRDMIAPGGLDASTRLLLATALSFKADWREKFDPARTAEQPFHLADGTPCRVPMMHQTADFRAIEHERFVAVNLLYEGFRLSMQLFVPRKIEDLPWLEKRVLDITPDTWQRDMEWRHVALTLPRFRFETTLVAGQLLREMGLSLAFDPEAADFSGLSSDRVWLSEVLHKTFIEVDEEGTAAAGATAAILSTGIDVEYRPLVVNADRPFLFTILGTSGLLPGDPILFLGRVEAP